VGGATHALRGDQRRVSQSETAEVEKRNQAAGYDCICV